jgi:hypothetical protein
MNPVPMRPLAAQIRSLHRLDGWPGGASIHFEIGA